MLQIELADVPGHLTYSDETALGIRIQMAIDSDYLLAREWPEITHRYTEKDSMLYALGVGLGRDPLSQDKLRFVYEDGLKVMPTQAVTLAHPGFWAAEEDIKLDWINASPWARDHLASAAPNCRRGGSHHAFYGCGR